MRTIPRNVELQLEQIGLTFHERQALAVYAERGVSPPNWVGEHIARRIGADRYLQAWAVLTLEQFAQSNLCVRWDNLPTLPLAATL